MLDIRRLWTVLLMSLLRSRDACANCYLVNEPGTKGRCQTNGNFVAVVVVVVVGGGGGLSWCS